MARGGRGVFAANNRQDKASDQLHQQLFPTHSCTYIRLYLYTLVHIWISHSEAGYPFLRRAEVVVKITQQITFATAMSTALGGHS